MDYQEYEVEDFLMDPGFRNYCLGKNEEDSAFWSEWVVLHPEKYETVRQARQLYAILNGNHSAKMYEREVGAFKAKLEEHLATAEAQPEESSSLPVATLPLYRSRKKLFYLSGAAAVLLVIALVAGRKLLSGATSKLPADGYARTSNAGERKSFQLPDGSKVMLNAGSRIHIPQDFNGKDREITLEGEAFFDVAKDAEKPFIIHTERMDIRVLGTSFNVKAYPEDKVTETSLINGSVEVLVKGRESRKIILHPSEKISIPNDTPDEEKAEDIAAKSPVTTPVTSYKVEKLIINPADSTPAEVSWTENRLAFNNNSFEEVAAELERWYNVSIQIEDPVVKGFRFTATFDKKTIEQILHALAVSRPFEYRWEGDKKIIINSSAMKKE